MGLEKRKDTVKNYILKERTDCIAHHSLGKRYSQGLVRTLSEAPHAASVAAATAIPILDLFKA